MALFHLERKSRWLFDQQFQGPACTSCWTGIEVGEEEVDSEGEITSGRKRRELLRRMKRAGRSGENREEASLRQARRHCLISSDVTSSYFNFFAMRMLRDVRNSVLWLNAAGQSAMLCQAFSI